MDPYIKVTVACSDGTFEDTRTSGCGEYKHAGVCLASALSAYCHPIAALAEAACFILETDGLVFRDDTLGEAERKFAKAADILNQEVIKHDLRRAEAITNDDQII